MRLSPFERRGPLAAAIQDNLPASSTWRALLGVAVLGLACHAPAASATTYTVDTANDTTTPGKTTLREAVFQANGSANNIVQFDPSINGSTITLSQGEITISQPMYVIGPGSDKLTISGNDASRIFNVSNAAVTPMTVKISGLRLTHGNETLGGAIETTGTSLTLENSLLDYNAGYLGGALFSLNNGGVASVSHITGTTITKNTANFDAGLFIAGGASVYVGDSVIAGNTASKEFGGADFYKIPSLTIARTRITDNKAQANLGGGVYIVGYSGSTAQINDSTISGNTALGSGGGLVLYNVTATLTGDTISGNSASNGGGIFVGDTNITVATQLTLVRSSVSGNIATSFGGGIDIHRALALTIDRSLINGNDVYDPLAGGGGIAIEYAKNQSNINDSTIYGNYAYANGGGVGMFSIYDITQFNGVTIANNLTFDYTSNGILGSGLTTLVNCIVANNYSRTSSQDLDGLFYEYYSLIRTVGGAAVIAVSSNKNGQDPLLGPLAVNGGPTLTMMPALLPNKSPALDAGTLSFNSSTDQRGLPRVANGRRDMGAVERQYPEDIIFRDGVDSS